jgi:cytoskeletal protein RodZ
VNQTSGARLKKIRLDKGLSLEAVQKQTKINAQILQALEGDGISTVSPVYLRSFLKLYCAFLGVDPKDYSQTSDIRLKDVPQKPPSDVPQVRRPVEEKPIAQAPARRHTEDVLQPPQARPRVEETPKASAQKRQYARPRAPKKETLTVTFNKIKAYTLAVVDVCAKESRAAYAKIRSKVLSIRISKEVRVYLVRGVVALVVLLIVIKVVVMAASGIKSAMSKRKVKKQRAPAAHVVRQQPSPQSKPPVAPAVAPGAVPFGKKAPETPVDVKKVTSSSEVKKEESKIRLIIRAKENSWINLKSDGKVVFQRILEKGRFETWEAKEKMELSVGNAGGVELDVNGQLFNNLGRRKQALKNIVITKEGLHIDR